MAIPTYDQLIEPLLKLLSANPEGMKKRDVHEALAKALSLSADDRAVLLPSGKQPVFENRTGWAHDRLKRSGLSESVTRGFWRLTEAGRQFLTKHRKGLDETTLRRLTVVGPESRVPTSSESESIDTSTRSPEERIDAAVQVLRCPPTDPRHPSALRVPWRHTRPRPEAQPRRVSPSSAPA